MPQLFHIHPDNPQPRLLRQAAQIIEQGGLAALPTDSAYALCGLLGDAQVLERIRRIRAVDVHHLFTLLCRDLSEIASYARVDNRNFRLLKATTPGSYTFILEGSRELPRRVLHPRRKTVGLRIPDHSVLRTLLGTLNQPVISSTLILPEQEFPLSDPEEICRALTGRIDLVVDAGSCPAGATTVINLTGDVPELLRTGRGALEPFGLRA
jgi:tRNA threonylcarbamoyl adenosine modification protein (Sua5/YciO/YrdC/YwlC family)